MLYIIFTKYFYNYFNNDGVPVDLRMFFVLYRISSAIMESLWTVGGFLGTCTRQYYRLGCRNELRLAWRLQRRPRIRILNWPFNLRTRTTLPAQLAQ